MPQKASSVSPVVEPLRRITDLWLDPASAIRIKSIEALQVSTGYSQRIIGCAIDNVFTELSREKLLTFIRGEPIHFNSRSDAIVLHIGAGNVFTSWLPGAVITLLMGYRCWIKPSSMEPVFARLWHESIRMVDFTMADRVSIVPWTDDLLGRVDAVFAYGSDKTLEELRKKVDPKSIFIGFGHKLSAAIAFREAIEPSAWFLWRQRAIDDCEMFQLNGCLSPQILYVEGEKAGAWELIGDSVQPAPQLRCFTQLEEVVQDMTSCEGHWSTIGVAGPVERLNPIQSQLERLGVSRICELGQMQRPPLNWKNGGISLVNELNRFRSSAAADLANIDENA